MSRPDMSDERPYCGSDHCPITLALQPSGSDQSAAAAAAAAAATPGRGAAAAAAGGGGGGGGGFDGQGWVRRFNAMGSNSRQLRIEIAQGTEEACRAWGYSHSEKGWVHLPKDFTKAMTKATQSYSNNDPALATQWEPRYLADTAIEVSHMHKRTRREVCCWLLAAGCWLLEGQPMLWTSRAADSIAAA